MNRNGSQKHYLELKGGGGAISAIKQPFPAIIYAIFSKHIAVHRVQPASEFPIVIQCTDTLDKGREL